MLSQFTLHRFVSRSHFPLPDVSALYHTLASSVHEHIFEKLSPAAANPVTATLGTSRTCEGAERYPLSAFPCAGSVGSLIY